MSLPIDGCRQTIAPAQRFAEVHNKAITCLLTKSGSALQDAQFWKLLEQHRGKLIVDGKSRDVSDIIGGSLSRLQYLLVDEESVSASKIATCSSTCGSESATKGQYAAILI